LTDGTQLFISVVFFVVLLYYCHVKAEKIIILWSRNKREEHRPQTETSRTDNVDEDKLIDTDEHQPFVETKLSAPLWRGKRKGEFSRKTLGPTDYSLVFVLFFYMHH